MHGTIDLPQQPRQGRVGLGLAAEERHLDAVAHVLIDQHRDVLAPLQGFRQLERRLAAGRHQRAHLDGADPFDGAVGGLDVRAAEQDRAVQPMRDRAKRRDLPIAEMAREDDRRLAVVAQGIENLLGPRAELDAARFVRMVDVVVPDVIEMGELGADAAEVVPDAGQNGFDLFRRFLGESGGEISRPMRSSRSLRPMKRVARPKKLAVLSGSK